MTDLVIVLNPGGPQAGASTPDSVNDIISMETNQLLALANQGGFGTRTQEALKRLVCSNVALLPTALTITQHRLTSVMVHDV